MIRTIVKVVAWLVGGFIGVLTLFYLLLLLVNWHDEEPSQTAKYYTELRANRSPVADEQNGFVYLLGMAIDSAHEPLQAGLAMIQKERQRAPEEGSSGYSHPEFPQGTAVKIVAPDVLDYLENCRFREEECLQFLASDKADGLRFGHVEQLLVSRYRSLITFSAWRDNDVTINGPIPSYSAALNGQKLALFDCWRHSGKRGINQCGQLLEEDARFWREVFDSSDSLITSMVTLNALKNNLFWTNLVMRREAANHSRIDIPPTWQRPISDDERIMERVWAGEWAFAEEIISNIEARGMGIMDDTEDGPSLMSKVAEWLLTPLLQPQDTLNRRAENFATLMEHYRVPYEQLAQVEERMSSPSEGFGGEGLSFPHMFYNPVGKILNEIARPSYSSYMLKAADLEGARRALLATIELRNGKTARDSVPVALQRIALTNPYTNEPFKWDEATGSVVFEGVGGSDDNRKRYSFVY